MEEGTVTKWHYVAGDQFKMEDVPCDIETEIESGEVEAQGDGVMVKVAAVGRQDVCVVEEA